MRSAIIGMVAGVGWLQVQAALPSQSVILLLLAAFVLLALALRLSRLVALKIPLLIVCGACFGFVWAALFAHYYLAQELPKELEGRDVILVGTIDSLPAHFEQGMRFNFAVERVVDPAGATRPGVPSRLALAWYSGFGSDETSTVAEVRPGERWQLTVRLAARTKPARHRLRAAGRQGGQ